MAIGITYVAIMEILWSNGIAMEWKNNSLSFIFEIFDITFSCGGLFFIALNISLMFKFNNWKIENDVLEGSNTLEKEIYKNSEEHQITFEDHKKSYIYRGYMFKITDYLTNKNAVYQDNKYSGFYVDAKRYINAKDNGWRYLLLLFHLDYCTFDGKLIQLTYYQDFYKKYFSSQK
ncbi:hypothetical protein ACX1NA_01655 [Mycoplasma sp. VS276A1]